MGHILIWMGCIRYLETLSKRRRLSSVIMYNVPPSELAIRLASIKIISKSLDIFFSFESAKPMFAKLPTCFSRA